MNGAGRGEGTLRKPLEGDGGVHWGNTTGAWGTGMCVKT